MSPLCQQSPKIEAKLSKKRAHRRRKAFEIDHRSRKIGLDGNIAQPTTHRTTQTMLGLCFTMHPLGSPAMPLVSLNKFIVWPTMASSRSKQRFVSITDQDASR